jgi:hypothetical protein
VDMTGATWLRVPESCPRCLRCGQGTALRERRPQFNRIAPCASRQGWREVVVSGRKPTHSCGCWRGLLWSLCRLLAVLFLQIPADLKLRIQGPLLQVRTAGAPQACHAVLTDLGFAFQISVLAKSSLLLHILPLFMWRMAGRSKAPDKQQSLSPSRHRGNARGPCSPRAPDHPAHNVD